MVWVQNYNQRFEVQMAIRPGGPAPYAPASAVVDLIHAFRNRSLATPFDLDVLQRAGVSASLAPRVLHALKQLELVDDDGNPLPAFEGLRRAAASDLQDRLAEVVRAAYGDIFQYVDPASDDIGRITDQFRQYEPIGQIRRMVSLFTGLCAASGIMPELAAQPARSRSGQKRQRRQAQPPTGQPGAAQQERARKTKGTPGLAGPDLPAPVAGLLMTIPRNGAGWTQRARDRFMATFTAVLDYSVPIVEENGDEE